MISYEQLIEQVDALTKRLSARYAKHLTCRAGCSGCCQHHLAVFPVEAVQVEAAVTGLPEEVRLRVEQQAREVEAREAAGEPVACPLLVDEHCSIYAARPLICRTQGLPLLFEAEDGSAEVDFCPLNFTTPEAVEDLEEQALVPLDTVNWQLALVNLRYGQAQGYTTEQSGLRQKLSRIILASRKRDLQLSPARP